MKYADYTLDSDDGTMGDIVTESKFDSSPQIL